jgi:glycerol-3-phosphate dehydrogenase
MVAQRHGCRETTHGAAIESLMKAAESPARMSTRNPQYDLLVVGAGINGAGIARDAAGRGLRVLIVEKGDLASATSQWSTKLIHGGLRYLEQYEFRLVHEALAEREVVLHQAPHIVEPLQFVLPHEPHLRPAWMLRAGLFLYDHLGRRETLPGSFGVDLASSKWGAGLKPKFHKGFVYSDARVDDARLVVFNVIDARDRGAEVHVLTRLVSAERRQDGGSAWWRVRLETPEGAREVTARVIVNASGNSVKAVRESINGFASRENVRHVKGSHIVVPRVHDEDHAYILQNADKRIVFVIPYQERYSLIGTTDIGVEAYETPRIDLAEIAYLLELANTYLACPLDRNDIVWTYSGVRPLYDDGSTDPSEITRDYVFEVDTGASGGAPILSIYGGKITTYRKLAEQALDHIARFLPPLKARWTDRTVLPGGDLPAGGLAAWIGELGGRYPALPAPLLRGLAHRHGTRALAILGGARAPRDLGEDFGQGLTEAEVAYFVRDEWARAGDDVLWRRTKCGIGMTDAERRRVEVFVASCPRPTDDSRFAPPEQQKRKSAAGD